MGYEKNVTQQVFPYQERVHSSLSWKFKQWTLSESFEMTSTGHPNYRHLGDTVGDIGGPWLMFKSTEKVSNFNVDNSLFKGPVGAGNPSDATWNSPSISSEVTDPQLVSYGSTMVARSLPNNPVADLSVGAAELFGEGLPSLIGLQTLRSRAAASRSAGGEYLNVEFGWKPLVSEVQSLARAVKDSEKIWSNYRKGSNNKTRVGYHLIDGTSQVVYTGNRIIPVPTDFNNFLTGTVVASKRDRVWFNGAFRYYVPDPGVDHADKMQHWSSQASKILGLKLDPEVLWNLAPWSWAIDWFTNTGDLFHNVSLLGQDGMVMQYGYAMAEQRLGTSRTATWHPYGRTAYRESVTKRCKRIPASPYGFGTTLSGLSARQTAILAALGLSRAG